MKIVHGFDVYRTYLAMKMHFTKENFDFFQYDGKVNAKEETYQQRPDFYFFETVARKYEDQEIKEYLLASFVLADDPTKVWIGDIKRAGKDNWLVWQRQIQSRSYNFEQDLARLVEHMEASELSFNQLFETSGGHPPLLKLHLKGVISLDTLIIMDMVLKFIPQWNKNLRDPLWQMISFKIKKYKPFMSIKTNKYKEMLQQRFL